MKINFKKEELIISSEKMTFDQAKENIPEGYRLPNKKELMLMYCMNDENKFELPKSNVWSSEEYIKRDGTSTSAFAVQFSNGYTGTIKKSEKCYALYAKK